jgi:hypothetical protein
MPLIRWGILDASLLDLYILSLHRTRALLQLNYNVYVKQVYYRRGQTLRVAGSWGSQISRQSAHEGGKFVSPTAAGHLYPPGNIPGTHFCWRLSRPQGRTAPERIMSMKNSNDIIGNRTRDLPACRVVPQPTAPLRYIYIYYKSCCWKHRRVGKLFSNPYMESH